MKKLLRITTLCMCVGTAYGAQTCIHDDTTVLILKKAINGTSSAYNESDMTWNVTFDYDLVADNPTYRTLYGDATCNEINSDSNKETVSPGANNVYLRASKDDTGPLCWCATSGPIVSWWTFLHEYDDDAECRTGCAAACAEAVKNNTNNFRSNGLFLAIW